MLDQIKEKLEKGASIKSIAEELNISYHQVQKVSKSLNFNFYNYKELKILEYAYCHTPNQICTMFGYGRPFVIKTYKKHNIPLEGSGGKNRVLQDISCFTKLNHSAMYWLGIIVTDGNLGSTKKTISIVQKDKELLEQFQKFLGVNISIYKVNECYEVLFGHKDLHKFITSLGIPAKKSIIVNPEFEFTWDFVRGLMDGDGHFSAKHRSGFVSCSKKLFDKLCNFLELHLGSIIKWSETSYTNTVTYRLEMNQKQTKQLINYLYKDAAYYLKRKFDLACEIAQKKPDELLGKLEIDNQQPS